MQPPMWFLSLAALLACATGSSATFLRSSQPSPEEYAKVAAQESEYAMDLEKERAKGWKKVGEVLDEEAKKGAQLIVAGLEQASNASAKILREEVSKVGKKTKEKLQGVAAEHLDATNKKLDSSAAVQKVIRRKMAEDSNQQLDDVIAGVKKSAGEWAHNVAWNKMGQEMAKAQHEAVGVQATVAFYNEVSAGAALHAEQAAEQSLDVAREARKVAQTLNQSAVANATAWAEAAKQRVMDEEQVVMRDKLRADMSQRTANDGSILVSRALATAQKAEKVAREALAQSQENAKVLQKMYDRSVQVQDQATSATEEAKDAAKREGV